MKNSLDVTNSSIKQTQMTSVNGYRGDECQNHADAETKSSESKRTSRLVRNSKLTGRTRRRAKHRVENETKKAKIETKKGSETLCFTVGNILTKEKLKDKSMLKHIMRKCKDVNDVDKETSSGTQISSRRRSSRTAPWLHRTCTVERRNTNLEELTMNNTADPYTKHLN